MLILWLCCLPALLILCVMCILADIAKRQKAEKRIFEKKKALDRRLKIALAERGRFGVTKTPRPDSQIKRGNEHTQAIIDYVNKQYRGAIRTEASRASQKAT